MATAEDLIVSSIRLMGVLESGEVPTTQEKTDALEVLNDLLASWGDTDGIKINDGDLLLSDAFPLDAAEKRAIRYALAVELYPEYKIPVDQIVAARAEELRTDLRRKYHKTPTLTTDSGLMNVSRRRQMYDINKG